MATSAAFPTGGRFHIIRLLGEGGMGEVWLAHDSTLGRDVVLKRTKGHSGVESERLLTEARRAACINHANVAQVYDVVIDRDALLIVMEHVNGRTLRTAFSEPCSLGQFLPVAKQICRGLSAAHSQHIIHCDIKPSNIMLTPGGDVKVLDFGIARPHHLGGQTVTLSNVAAIPSGTPGYMAPEMLREQELDERADIFSLGVVFYELLTGVHPFEGASRVEVVERTLREPPAPFAKHGIKAPAKLESLVLRMLAKKAADRPDTSYILRELETIERDDEQSTILLPKPWWRSIPRRDRRVGTGDDTRMLSAKAMLLLVSALAVLAVGTWVFYRIIHNSLLPRTGVLTVIPFRVIGDDKESQSFADGLLETLTSRLTRISEPHKLQVTAASEVARRKVATPKAARGEFGADYAIEGSLHRTGDSVRVTYSLVDTKTLQQAASDSVTAAISDPFTLEDKIVSSILDLLNVKLQPGEKDSLARRSTSNATGYGFFLKGLGNLHDYDDPQNLPVAIDYFHRALQADPNYAPAYARLGEAFWRRYESTQNSNLIDAARQACARAIALDDILPESHICLGVIATGTGKYQEAAQAYDRAVTLDPQNDDALRGLANAYGKLDKPAEAEQAYKRGIAARPSYWAGHTWLGAFYVQMARYDEAAEEFKLAAKYAPKNALVYYSLGGTYIYQGKYSDAISALKTSIDLRPSQASYINLGQAYLHVHQYKEAIDAYEHAVALGQNSAVLYTLYSSLADAYYWAGLRDKATPAYQHSIELGSQQLAVNPNDTDVHTVLAVDYAALGVRDAAHSHIVRALQDGTHDPEILFYAARVHQRLNDVPAAMQWLKKAVAAGYSRADIDAAPEFDAVRNTAAYLDAISASSNSGKAASARP